MKILLIGSKGQLGWELERQGNDSGFEIIGVDLPEIDITDKNQVEHLVVSSKPLLLINAAAYTQVDKAETDRQLAFAVNRDGSANLADCCSTANIPLIHISTDYVFDGSKTSPYLETDPPAPLGVYGKSKEEGEKEVRSRLTEHIIIRTSWLYGVHGYNFVKTMLKLGKEREILRVVADQYGSPTCAADLAEAILIIAGRIRQGKSIILGTYHYCGGGITTWYEFTEKILELARQYGPIQTRRIEAITTDEYPTAAKRPAFSVLNCSLIKQNFGIDQKPWQESLKKTIYSIFYVDK